jgi:hypothetical protein
VLLDGHPDDVEAQARVAGLPEAPAGPPDLPPHRWSLRPSELAALAGGPDPFVAEVGVGVVHRAVPPPVRPVDPAVVALHRRLKAVYDPTGRLAPGRDPLAAAA